jgi:hypothetical protein
MDDCNHYYLSFYFVMYGNIRYWGYVSGVVACTLRTIKGATDVWSIAYMVVVYIVFVQFTSINALENNGIQIGMYGISSAHLPVQSQVLSVIYSLRQGC